ncbi:hypothetical protein Tco_0612561 [Tanacetum coccineum]
MLTRWRSKVASRSSSPTTSTLEIPTAPILPAPSAVVAPYTDIISHVDAPPMIRRQALTARKSVRPLPSHRLALRHTSHHLDRFISGSLSGHSSLDHSSSGHSISGHSLSRHASPDTTVADSSTPPRFVYPPLSRTPRSPATTVTSSIHAMSALVPSYADLFLPRKRFRDSISLEDSVEEDIDTDVLADIEADAMTDEVAVDRDVEAEVNASIGMEVDVGVDVEDEVEDEVESSNRGTMEVGVDVVVRIDIPGGMLMPDVVERLEQVEEGLQDIYGHVKEIPLQRIEDIETVHKGLEARSLITGAERASLLEQIGDIRCEAFRGKSKKELVNPRVEDSLDCSAYDGNPFLRLKNHKPEQQHSGSDNGKVEIEHGGLWKGWRMEMGEMKSK